MDKFKTLWKTGKYFKIYIVDGKYVRDNIDDDFHLGGHSAVYSYIPEGEIWLENKEDAILLHEVIEHVIMEYLTLDYAEAHAIATQFETLYRELNKAA